MRDISHKRMACVIAGYSAFELIGLLESAYVAEEAVSKVVSKCKDITHAYNKGKQVVNTYVDKAKKAIKFTKKVYKKARALKRPRRVSRQPSKRRYARKISRQKR